MSLKPSGVDGTGAYSAPGAAKLTTLYNKRELPTGVLFCDHCGCTISRGGANEWVGDAELGKADGIE